MTASPERKLALTLPLEHAETAVSLVPRLAFRNGVETPREFLKDMGISWRRFNRGAKREITMLAERADVDPDQLRRFSPASLGGGFYQINSQRLRRPMLNHAIVRFCPVCVLQALQISGPQGVYQSAQWLIITIQNCATHQCRLHPVKAPPAHSLFDLGAHVAANAVEIKRLAKKSPHAPNTPFEQYMLARLHGAAPSCWLDSLEYYVAALSCFQLGVLIEHGPAAKTTDLTNVQLSDAQNAGFLVLRRGPDALVAALDLLKGEGGVSHLGFARDYKVFFDWLNRPNLGSDFEPVRHIVREYIFRSFPIPRGERVFGVPCPHRYLHTLGTVSSQHRVCQKKLTDRLIELGLGVKDTKIGAIRLPNYFDANVADQAAISLKEMLDVKAAMKAMNITETAFRQLLSSGYIVPEIKGGKAAKRYSRVALDRFLRELEKNAAIEVKMPTHCKSISRASLNAKCQMIDIVGKILSDDIKYVGKLEGKRGFGALVVDCREIRQFEFGGSGDGLTKRQASKALGVNESTIKRLVEAGYLNGAFGRNPSTRHSALLIAKQEIDTFQTKFITLGHLAKLVGAHPVTAKKRLNEASLSPVVSGPHVNGVYRRSEVCQVFQIN